MMTAFPARTVAARRGLNRNHHMRVWCTCMADQKAPPGYFRSGPYSPERPSHVVAADPRRLGGWDDLGVVDVRVPNSAVDLWRQHVREADDA